MFLAYRFYVKPILPIQTVRPNRDKNVLERFRLNSILSVLVKIIFTDSMKIDLIDIIEFVQNQFNLWLSDRLTERVKKKKKHRNNATE